jgi:hypothetical protein
MSSPDYYEEQPQRRPSRIHPTSADLQTQNYARIAERLNFLDPQLEATHSRIDVLETICQANTDRIEAIAKDTSNTDRSARGEKSRPNEP